MKPEIICTVLSRRKLLRDSVIAATGVVLVPPMFTGCTKEGYQILPRRDPKGGITVAVVDLKAAADNITQLRAFLEELYPLTLEYEEAVFHALASTPKNDGWANFIVDIFIDITALLAAAAAIATGGAAAVPAIACLSAFLHDWGIGKGDRPANLEATFSEFEKGHGAMQLAVVQKLRLLEVPANNYSNLREAWKDGIAYNGTAYTIEQLATLTFPTGKEYNSMQTAALTSFKKSLWNLVIMKTCTLYRNYPFALDIYKDDTYRSVTDYAQKQFYPAYRGCYLRGYIANIDPGQFRSAQLEYWNLGIGGYAFPEAACNMLFMDDTPGHLINPDGLFNRSYVFEQFSISKPDFSRGHELASHVEQDFNPSADDWEFTGGAFAKLIKK